MPREWRATKNVRQIEIFWYWAGSIIFLYAPAAISGVCDQAALFAARETGVPYEVLQTITRVETGRLRGDRLEPWPWAINLSGEGFWFSSGDEALSFAFQKLKQGKKNFDTGCFQINYRWHGGEFSSISEMFDPDANALYAAQFLSRLFKEFGSWERAAGAYHSRTKIHADRYKALYRDIYASLGGSSGARDLPLAQSNSGALIAEPGGGPRMPGSLVTLSTTTQTAFVRFD